MSLTGPSSSALPAAPLASPSATVLGQLDPPAFLENLAIRSTGDILATELRGGPHVYRLANPASPHPSSLDRLASIPSLTGLLGITELPTEGEDETFIVVGGNFTSTPPSDPVVGGYSAWALSFDSKSDGVSLSKVSDLSDSDTLLNGVTSVSGLPDIVLVADSIRGLVGRLDVSAGAYDDTAFSFPEMLPTPGSTQDVGINGIKVNGPHLYFTNTATVSVYRVPLTPDAYPLPGAEPELVADVSHLAAAVDDFTFDAAGHIYIATNHDGKVVRVDAVTNERRVLIGGQSDWAVAGGSSAAFGRDPLDSNTLYLSAVTSTIGNVTEGARIIAVEL